MLLLQLSSGPLQPLGDGVASKDTKSEATWAHLPCESFGRRVVCTLKLSAYILGRGQGPSVCLAAVFSTLLTLWRDQEEG